MTKFPLGQIVATPGALEAFQRSGQAPTIFLARHQAGDWGEVCPEDKAENELSLQPVALDEADAVLARDRSTEPQREVEQSF